MPLRNLPAIVNPLLDEGEAVWAVFENARRALVATPRRLFIVAGGRVDQIPLDEIADLRRAGESTVILERRHGAPLDVDLDPEDEQGLQALTVIGLLAGCRRRLRGSASPRRPGGGAWNLV